MATTKQQRAAQELVGNGGNVTKAMIAAGYSPATANTPGTLTQSKAWPELLEKFVPDSLLVKKHKEQLEASKHTRLYFDIDDDDDLIEDVCKRLGVELLYIKINKDKTGKTANVKAPDFFFRDLALDKGYKVKGRYAQDGAPPIQNNIFVGMDFLRKARERNAQEL